mmetsp:Transcript_36929/g.87752  ORF Transcript_36929/g.87752 Transcript_36929/m.87752 type:complete len:109 (-) Transcript_36929:98-424(-)
MAQRPSGVGAGGSTPPHLGLREVLLQRRIAMSYPPPPKFSLLGGVGEGGEGSPPMPAARFGPCRKGHPRGEEAPPPPFFSLQAATPPSPTSRLGARSRRGSLSSVPRS